MSTGNEKETLEVMEIMYILTCFNRSDQVCTATPNIIYFFLKRVPGNVLNITLSEHKPLITLQVLPVVSFTVKHCFTIFLTDSHCTNTQLTPSIKIAIHFLASYAVIKVCNVQICV